MRRIAMWVLALGLAAVPAMASGGADKTTDSAKPAATNGNTTGTTAPGTKATNPNQPGTAAQPANSTNSDDTKKTNVEAEVEELRALIRAQADQLEEQHIELEAMKAKMGTEPASGSTTSAPADSTVPSTATVATPASGAPNSVEPTASPRPMGQDTTSGDKPSPLFFKIGNANFTPGGFLDL